MCVCVCVGGGGGKGGKECGNKFKYCLLKFLGSFS